MQGYCPNCDCERELRREARSETYTVRKDAVSVEGEVSICAVCGEHVLDPKRDDDLLRRVYAEYRGRHGLLGPEQIREKRGVYGLSQRALSRLLGWGPITIQRYEQGALQDEAHDVVLRQLDKADFVLSMLARNGHRLSEREREHIGSVAAGLTRPDGDGLGVRSLEDWVRVSPGRDDRETGFRDFSIERFAQLVLWLAESAPGLFKTKLAKLLWLCDFLHFRRHAVGITGLAYARLPHGPVPDGFSFWLLELERRHLVSLRPEEHGEFEGEIIEPPARVGGLSGAQLSDLSHREAVWRSRRNGDVIPYTEADRLDLLADVK